MSENEYPPNKNTTREQIATIIYRCAKANGYDVSVGENTNILSYTDAKGVSEYAILRCLSVKESEENAPVSKKL